MKIQLYRNTADPRVVDKTSYLSLVMEMDGYLREECSVSNPIMTLETHSNIQRIQAEGEDVEASGDLVEYQYQEADALPEFNYAYIPDFKRYYFVNEIVSVRTGLWRVSLRSDPLMSFRDEFVNWDVRAFVTRNAYEYNNKLEDPLISWSDEVLTSVREVNLDLSLYHNFKFDSGTAYVADEKRYTVSGFVSAGKRQDIIGFTDYGSEPWAGAEGPFLGLPGFDSVEQGLTANTIPYVMSKKEINMLQYKITLNDTMIGAVVGAVAWPFKIPDRLIGSKIYLALGDSWVYGNTLDSHKCECLTISGTLDYLILCDFVCPSVDSIYELPTHSKWDIFIPYYGWTDLDISVYGGDRLMVYYSLSLVDGTGEVFLYDVTKKCVAFSATVQVGTRFAFNSNNSLEIGKQRDAIATQAVLGVAGGLLSIAGGNIPMGVLAIAGTAANTAIKSSQLFDRSSVGFYNPQAGNMSPQKCYLRHRSHPMAFSGYSSLDEFTLLKGRPLMATRSLKSLHGFTMVDEIKFETSATKPESDEIRALLKSGVIL